MKSLICTIVISFLAVSATLAQGVAINHDNSVSDPNTILDIKSDGNTDAHYGFKVKNWAGTNQLVVRSDGVVGIGDDSPDATLEVVDAGVDPFMVSNGSGGDGDFLIVQTDGNVGIGNAAPTDKLQVAFGHVRIGELTPQGSGTTPGYGRRLYFSGGPGNVNYNSDNSDPIYFSRYNAALDMTELRLNLSDNCQSGDAFVIQSGGSGCSANTEYFRFDAIGAAYKPGGGSFSTLSDARLKKNINPFEAGIEVLSAVKPVVYQYNGMNHTPSNDQTYVGVIAQQLQTVAPDMVHELGDYLSVDPSAFTYLLIN